MSQGGHAIVQTDDTSPDNSQSKPSASKVSNLGDVTAKSGSQSIAASLIGTALGIFLSQTFCADHGTSGILAGFVVLSAVHQVCTYKAVKAVPLRSLDRHRLHIVLADYVSSNERVTLSGSEQSKARENWKALTPTQVAEKESFLPMIAPDDSVKWLNVGAPLQEICPKGVSDLERLLLPKDASIHSRGLRKEFDSKQYERYILNIRPEEGLIQLTFFEDANDSDQLCGMLHAYFAREALKGNVGNDAQVAYETLSETHAMMLSEIPMLTEQLHDAGWQIGSDFVNVECGSSHRLKILNA